MTALGMMTFHLRIADFKCTHNSMICDRLLDTEIIFGINIQMKFSISYAWDKSENCYIQKDDKFLTYTRNCDQKVMIGIVKLTLKIPTRHNCLIPSKFTGEALKEHMAYFITNDDSTKGKDPSINIVNGVHDIKGKTSVNILVPPITQTDMSQSTKGNTQDTLSQL